MALTKKAVDDGFSDAITVILDANITHFIVGSGACTILVLVLFKALQLP